MSAALFDSISRIARHEARARAVSGIGTVVDIHPSDADNDHAVTVQMRDSGLVLPRVPIAVGVMGYAAIPAVDDLVVITFLEGDLNAPVVVGRLYHADMSPPQHAAGEIVLNLPAGESEPKLKLKIVGGDPSIQLELPGDVKITAKEESVVVEVGDLKLSIEGTGGGRIEAAAGSSKLTLKKDGDITLSSSGKIKIEGTEIEIAGSAKTKVTGAVVEIN